MRRTPIEILQRPLRPGTVVRVKVGSRAGRVFHVAALLTGKDEPAYLTGAARYAIDVGADRIADYARHELVAVSRGRRAA